MTSLLLCVNSKSYNCNSYNYNNNNNNKSGGSWNDSWKTGGCRNNSGKGAAVKVVVVKLVSAIFQPIPMPTALVWTIRSISDLFPYALWRCRDRSRASHGKLLLVTMVAANESDTKSAFYWLSQLYILHYLPLTVAKIFLCSVKCYL